VDLLPLEDAFQPIQRQVIAELAVSPCIHNQPPVSKLKTGHFAA
jgi:hypothetical protein